MDEICEHVARYPHWVLGVVVVAYSATTFASTWVAARIGNRWAGIVVILILTLAIVFNIAKLPYAMWFKVVMLSCFAVACYFGCTRGVRALRARQSLRLNRDTSATCALLLSRYPMMITDPEFSDVGNGKSKPKTGWRWLGRLFLYPLLGLSGCHMLMTGSPIPDSTQL